MSIYGLFFIGSNSYKLIVNEKKIENRKKVKIKKLKYKKNAFVIAQEILSVTKRFLQHWAAVSYEILLSST